MTNGAKIDIPCPTCGGRANTHDLRCARVLDKFRTDQRLRRAREGGSNGRHKAPRPRGGKG